MSIPSYTYTQVNGQQVVTREEWSLEGKYHRVDGPAWRKWQIVNGLGYGGEIPHPVLTCEEWWVADKLHRVDGPAGRQWQMVNGLPVLTCESWCIAGKLHRVDGPALQMWQPVNGLPVLTYESWCIAGKLHRVDGPARRTWQIVSGLQVLTYEQWWLRDTMVDAQFLPSTALTLQRWFRRYQRQRWSFIEHHLLSSGLTVFPGLIRLLNSY